MAASFILLPPEEPTPRLPPWQEEELGLRLGDSSLAPANQTDGQQQITTSGRNRSQNVVPAWSKKASFLASIDHENGRRVSDGGAGRVDEDVIHMAFHDSMLIIDEPSDREIGNGEPQASDKPIKGENRVFSCNQASSSKEFTDRDSRDLQSGGSGHNSRPSLRSDREYRYRQPARRAMREFDNNLDAFNKYAQNGFLPLANSGHIDPLRPHGNTIYSGSIGDLHEFDPIHSRYFDALSNDRPMVPVGDGFDALDVMGDHIFRIGAQKKKWFKAPGLGDSSVATGVTIRARMGLYRSFPVNFDKLQPFETAMAQLNPEVSAKFFYFSLRLILQRLGGSQNSV